MDINQLIELVKKKITTSIEIENISIKDKTFLHKNHINNSKNNYHLELKIQSNELIKLTRIQSTKKIYKLLEYEMKNYIHSIQILII